MTCAASDFVVGEHVPSDPGDSDRYPELFFSWGDIRSIGSSPAKTSAPFSASSTFGGGIEGQNQGRWSTFSPWNTYPEIVVRKRCWQIVSSEKVYIVFLTDCFKFSIVFNVFNPLGDVNNCVLTKARPVSAVRGYVCGNTRNVYTCAKSPCSQIP